MTETELPPWLDRGSKWVGGLIGEIVVRIIFIAALVVPLEHFVDFRTAVLCLIAAVFFEVVSNG